MANDGGKIQKVDKYPVYPRLWGKERWIVNTDKYCGKLLYLTKGMHSSMHYHAQKTETMYLQSGQVEIKFIDPADACQYSHVLCPGESLTIPQNQAHQIFAIEESELFEFSTQHFENDSYKISPAGKYPKDAD